MSKITHPTAQWRSILLLIHLIAYALFFIYALDNFSLIWHAVQGRFMILFLWTPLFLLHVATHFHHAGGANAVMRERQAYRDGFADAMNQRSSPPDVIDLLSLHDEDELLEVPEKRKRHV